MDQSVKKVELGKNNKILVEQGKQLSKLRRQKSRVNKHTVSQAEIEELDGSLKNASNKLKT